MSSYSFVYPNFNFFDFYNYLYLVLMIGIFSSLLYASYQARLYFFLAYILFLPISGLFYVPYMEFSYVANHWFYPSYGFIIALLVVGLQKIKNIQTKRLLTFSIATLIFFQFINLSFSLRSTKDYFYKNLALNPSSTILYEYLIEIEKKDSNYSQALYLAEELLHFTENKLPVIDTLIQISSNMDTKLYRKFVLLKSKIALKLGNIVLAKDALREFPFKENDKDYLFYNSIFELITKKSITEEQSISIKKFLLE